MLNFENLLVEGSDSFFILIERPDGKKKISAHKMTHFILHFQSNLIDHILVILAYKFQLKLVLCFIHVHNCIVQLIHIKSTQNY